MQMHPATTLIATVKTASAATTANAGKTRKEAKASFLLIEFQRLRWERFFPFVMVVVLSDRRRESLALRLFFPASQTGFLGFRMVDAVSCGTRRVRVLSVCADAAAKLSSKAAVKSVVFIK